MVDKSVASTRKRLPLLQQKWGFIILLLGGILTILACKTVDKTNHQQIENSIHENVLPLFKRVAERFSLYVYGVQEARTAVLVGGGRYVTHEDFYRFGLTLDLEQGFPGSRGFGFVRRVPQQDVAAFLDDARADRNDDFTLQEFAANPQERFILQYMEPYQISTNHAVVGLDLGSEPRRRAAAIDAMLSGEARMTVPIELKLDQTKAQNSFVIFLAVYRGGQIPVTEEARAAACFGWLIAPLELHDVLGDIAPDPSLLDFQISDLANNPQPFYHIGNSDGLFPIERDIAILGRNWRFHAGVTPKYLSRLQLISVPMTAALGIIFTALGMLAILLFNVYSTSRRSLAQEQTKLRAIVESSADAIIGKTIDGMVMSWNSGAEKIFGYSAQEAIGRPLKQLILPKRLYAEEESILTKLRQGETVEILESVRHHKDGHEIPVSCTLSPIFTEDAQVVGVSKTMRDISKQKAADAKIRELNSNLEQQVAQRTAELAELNLLFETVISAASEFSIIATDTEGVIRLFSHGAERMLGYRAVDIVDVETPIIFHVAEEVNARAEVLSAEFGQPIAGFDVFVFKARNLASDQAEYQEWTYIAKDGHTFPIRLVVNAMRDEQQRIIGYLGIASDVTKEKAAKAALNAANDKLWATTQTLITASRTAGLGIWQIEYGDYSVVWNDKMYEIYHLQATDEPMTFERWAAMLHPDDVEHVLEVVNTASEENVEYDVAFRACLEDGAERYIQGAATIECDAEGQPLRMIGINIDITEQRLLNQRLIEAKDSADAANAAKSMFLANVSHEIRTPMNAVLGMLQLLLKTPLQQKQHDFVTKARIAATSLLELLNDILDYSKIESGKLELDPHPFDFNALMQHLAVVMSSSLRDKPIELLFDFDERLPPHLMGDELRLQQVMINLLSNAIKFTEQGEVVVRLKVKQLTAKQVTFELSVTDSGIGISPEQQQRIFEGFIQAEASTTRRFGGTGLGLVISKRLIALMGGELQLKSALGEGSCFYFDLTLAINHEIDWQPQQLGGQPKVLVVDDNDMARALATASLERLHARVDAVADGEAALHQLRQAEMAGEPYDCVLLDWLMPKMDGLAVAESAFEQLAPSALPKFILISAANHEDLPSLSESCPIDLVLSKPVTSAQLAQAVTDVLYGINPKPLALVEDHWGEGLTGLNILLVEDNSFNQAVAMELLSGEGAKVTLAVDGLEGLHQVREYGEDFDVVLMDMQMPKMDGLSATRLIRQDERFKQLPIVAMTANVSQQDRDSCLAAGINAHLAKPLDFPEVVATIQRLTSCQRADKKPTIKRQEHDRLTQILQRFGGNQRLYAKLLESFKRSFEQLLQALQVASEQHQWALVQTTLHTMKGSAGTAGLTELYDAILAKESALKHAAEQDKASLLGGAVAAFALLAQQEYQDLHELMQAHQSNKEVNDEQAATSPPLKVLVAELRSCLQAGNMKAIELVEQLAERLDGALAPQLSQLQQLTENLEFEQALLCLAELWSAYEA
ncbi:hybrid sensor histidine kinase/response regulator [Shewanella mangrovi]|uniref:hybrid sensor histidine kinase/response regulator n=1 Tax=Shewanella mangrovi TaxID=1515746 RepID=UPI00056BBD64|nr:hybrid sensor histidine kinase/response regulator [Shewanella mangrovi]